MASAHIITAVIGSGVLSLAWAAAQLGWVAVPVVMLLFSLLLAACNRSGDSHDGVGHNLGRFKVKLCGMVQYLNLFGVVIGYTIATFISMIAIKKSIWTSILYMLSFGIVGIRLFQIPELWWFSIVAAVMFIYSTIKLVLEIIKDQDPGHLLLLIIFLILCLREFFEINNIWEWKVSNV